MHPLPRQTARVLRPHLSRRAFTTRPALAAAPPFRPGPAPPRLPKEEQELFEKLQQQSTGAFSTPTQNQHTPVDEQSPATDAAEATPPQPRQQEKQPTTKEEMLETLRARARVAANGEGEELHPHVRRGAQAEFEGERNPMTGEVGGPKNNPLRWGEGGDWSYNGRVTDF